MMAKKEVKPKTAAAPPRKPREQKEEPGAASEAVKSNTTRPKQPRTLKEHCEDIRTTLVALYQQSMTATHPVVQGSLREGFVRQVLGGFLGRSASWSSGQVVGHAPANSRSGQMDLLLHDDVLPQIYMYDGVLCLVPHDALFGAIEVKSNLTTGKKGTSVLDQALDSLVEAMRICGHAKPRPAFVIAAFFSGQRQATLIAKVSAYLERKGLTADDYWPDAIVVLSGGTKHPNGIGIFRDCLAHNSGEMKKVNGLTKELWAVDGGDAIGGLVALLSKHRVDRSAQSNQFDFAKYIFSASQEVQAAEPTLSAEAAPPEGAAVPTEPAQ